MEKTRFAKTGFGAKQRRIYDFLDGGRADFQIKVKFF